MKKYSRQPAPQGLEPVSEVETATVRLNSRRSKNDLRMTVRGRSIRLRGLHHPPTGAWRWLAILGPGIIAAAAGNDAGGVATYSQVGAQYGYELLWVMFLITVSLAVVQEMCARLGAATGRGLLDLIRERFGTGWAIFAVAVVLIANGGLVISEFVAVGASLELLGVSKYISVPVAALLIWYLVVVGNYQRVEKVFLAMTLVFFAYPITVFFAHPDWTAVARGTFVPKIRYDVDYLTLLVGLIGTTITPYMQLFQQSSIVEKGVARKHYGDERVDSYAGAIFSNLMSGFMIIATAATLHVAGKTEIESAADAAKALEPVAGHAAKILFAVGLLGASLLAGAVIPLATAYAISEAFGFAKGIDLDFRRARIFFSLFTALIVIGAGIALIPNLPVIKLLVAIQVLNGVLLPVILVFIMILANDKSLTEEMKNTKTYNILGWTTVVVITLAVIAMLGFQAAQWLGLIPS
jgi:NRAMP (natural resistance-associated macrophage protein)-like metal ion transporter